MVPAAAVGSDAREGHSQRSAVSGVYEIVNTLNGKRYIGSASNFRTRWRRHQWELANSRHPNKILQQAWSKYGAPAFQFRELLVCAPEHLLIYEQCCLDGLTHEYNLSPSAGSLRGFKHSMDVRARMVVTSTGRKHTAEARQKMSAARIGNNNCVGRKLSAETRQKILKANLGRKWSAAQRAKMEGSECTPETRAKMSAASLGRHKSPEHTAKLKANFQAIKRARKALFACGDLFQQVEEKVRQ